MKIVKSQIVDPILFLYMFAVYFESMWTPIFVRRSAYDHYRLNAPNDSNHSCTANGTNSSTSSPEEEKAEALASDWLLYFSLSSNIPAIVLTLLTGGLSDAYGRRLLIIIPSIGAAIEAICFIIIMAFKLPLFYLLIGNVIQGLTGGGTMLLMGVFSYASDVSSTNDRTWRLGVLESMTFVGGCLGLILGGVVVQKSSAYVIEGIAVACHLFNAVYAWRVLIESTPQKHLENSETIPLNVQKKKNKENTKLSSICSWRKIASFIEVFAKGTLHRPRWLLMLAFTTFGVYTMVVFGIGDIQYLYLLGHPLCWSSSTIGYFGGFRYIAGWFAALVILPVFSKYFHFRDTTIVLISIFTMVPSLAMEAFASKTWMMFLVPVIGICGGATQPSLRSVMSKLAGKDRQGALFSTIASLETVVTLSAASIFNPLYGAMIQEDISIFPADNGGAVCFFVMACLLLVPLATILPVHVHSLKNANFDDNEGEC